MKSKHLEVVGWHVDPISDGRFRVRISAVRINTEGEKKYFTIELLPETVQEMVSEVMRNMLGIAQPDMKAKPPEPAFTTVPKARQEVIDPDTGLIDHFPKEQDDKQFKEMVTSLGFAEEPVLPENLPGIMVNDEAGPDGDKWPSAKLVEVGKLWSSGYLDSRPRTRADVLTGLSGQNIAWLVKHKPYLPKDLRHLLVDYFSADQRNIVGPSGQGRNFTTTVVAELLDDDETPMPDMNELLRGRIK